MNLTKNDFSKIDKKYLEDFLSHLKWEPLYLMNTMVLWSHKSNRRDKQCLLPKSREYSDYAQAISDAIFNISCIYHREPEDVVSEILFRSLPIKEWEHWWASKKLEDIEKDLLTVQNLKNIKKDGDFLLTFVSKKYEQIKNRLKLEIANNSSSEKGAL
jgi:hypothetical protein